MQKLDFEEKQVPPTEVPHESTEPQNLLKIQIKSIHKNKPDYKSDSQSIHVEYTVIAKSNLRKTKQVINVVYKAAFIVKPILSKEAIQAFVNINGIAIVYPFIRETVFNVTVRSRGGGLILPIMNFINEYRKNVR